MLCAKFTHPTHQDTTEILTAQIDATSQMTNDLFSTNTFTLYDYRWSNLNTKQNIYDSNQINEPPHGKTNNLHGRKQRRRSASRTAKLISAFVFATRIVQFLLYLTLKFQASSSFLCLYRSVCVRPVRKPHCWFSHEVAH